LPKALKWLISLWDDDEHGTQRQPNASFSLIFQLDPPSGITRPAEILFTCFGNSW
jgi:hypothetical protein